MKRGFKILYVILACTFLLAACSGHSEEKTEQQETDADTKKEAVRVINGNAGADETGEPVAREAEAKEQAAQNDNEEADPEAKEPSAEGIQGQGEGAVQKKGILIALDPGHQGWHVDMSATEPNAPGSGVMKAKATSGTSGTYSGIPEFQLCLDISLMLKSELESRGYDVLMTREDNDTAISNSERATLANDAGADISVRIHANGSEDPGAKGALALITSPDNPYTGGLYGDSARLAEQVLSAYCAATGLLNQGIQLNDTMTGINWSQIPVMILEMGFMTNEDDDLKMADPDFRIKMVQGIADGIDHYYE